LAEYRVASSSLEQVAIGARWLEGPVWFGDGRYLLVSDIRGRFLSRHHCQSWVSIIFLLRHHHLPNDTPQMHVGIDIRESGLPVIEIHCLSSNFMRTSTYNHFSETIIGIHGTGTEKAIFRSYQYFSRPLDAGSRPPGRLCSPDRCL
jgi:hypothetical protein